MWSYARSRWRLLGFPGRWCCCAAAFLLLVPFTAGGLGFVLGRSFRSSAAGWGDLIGAVVGIYLGAWLASVCVFAVSARLASRPWWFVVLVGAALFPGLLVGVGAAARFSVPFPMTLGALVVGVSLVSALAGASRRSGR